jgi:hypothetical protein
MAEKGINKGAYLLFDFLRIDQASLHLGSEDDNEELINGAYLHGLPGNKDRTCAVETQGKGG